jgi:CPA2 family monovalent cation:H+ antiporter-2
LNVFLLRMAGFRPGDGAGRRAVDGADRGVLLRVGGGRPVGFGAHSVTDIYRLAIAVTAISLLVSPIWFNLMERVEDLASESLSSYKQALAQAYEDELDGVENVVWATRARYRAARFALYQRKDAQIGAQGTESADSAAATAEPAGAAAESAQDVAAAPASGNAAERDTAGDGAPPPAERSDKGTA